MKQAFEAFKRAQTCQRPTSETQTSKRRGTYRRGTRGTEPQEGVQNPIHNWRNNSCSVIYHDLNRVL